MVRVKLNGISVDLPYEPYVPQLSTISTLIQSFQTNSNALIESPTGTGKSLSILCSALAYLEDQKRNQTPEKKPSKIFVCSRTHKQIDQLIEQLRKTSYSPKITILGSKNQYCINTSLQNSEDKNSACDVMLKTRSCIHFHKREQLVKTVGNIFDIEELKTAGKECGGCPYYAARSLQSDADIIFAPYNYLVDEKIREASEVKLDGSILIVDEAHNIEDSCRAAGSLEIKSKDIGVITGELVMAVRKSAMLGEIKTEFNTLATIMKAVETRSEEKTGEILRGKEIIQELEKMGLGGSAFISYKNALDAISKNEEAKKLLSMNGMRFLEELKRILGIVIFSGSECYGYCFTKDGKSKYVHSLWLLNPSIIFVPLVKSLKSVCLLSGTLSPFSSFTRELSCQFHNELVAPHIIRPEQVFIAAIKRGHLHQELCGTYQVAETNGYVEQIGKAITDIAGRVNGGTLVFVPSYHFLNKLQGKVDGIFEPRDGGTAELEKSLKKYKEKIKRGLTAIFICVFRGKASEGVDFKDELARAVVAVGIPYPALKDPQIVLKKEYNDKKGGFNGRMWYETQAYRAVNQALGRAIRHSKDWGAVFLLDSRYGEKRYQGGLSKWVLGNLRVYESYEKSKSDLNDFLQKLRV